MASCPLCDRRIAELEGNNMEVYIGQTILGGRVFFFFEIRKIDSKNGLWSP